MHRSTIKLLRIPFSFFLSPIYLFALALVPRINFVDALLVFFILHFLIYPASNGYNSYMDRDTGPIGGLEKPPAATSELYKTSIFLDLLAIALSAFIGPLFVLAVLPYIGASKAYSYRRIRLKKYPVIGYLTVILFQGAYTFALVWYGSNQVKELATLPWTGMIICALLVGGFYPLTQIYQHKQDLDDGVQTISYKLGYSGTFIFCALVYVVAWVLMAQFFISNKQLVKLLVIGIFFVPVIVYFLNWFAAVRRDSKNADFRNAMRMNWIAAACTNLAFLILLIWNIIE